MIVGNDTNAALVAERFFGDCSPNSMLISIGRGVGAALCLNDVIIEGSSFTAGEIAHVVVDPNGPICECGKQGCLES
ncbi:ROK family protein, partial [Acinetobacter baumannii]|uniref:ROK family protein n=1 Tax=Acinetobacter baumannii TaxID=470 RepID=UPI0033312D80